jgi:hypothetical protein
MGLEFKAVRQRVDFHPLVSPLANSAVHTWTRKLLQRDPSNPFLAKAEGMLHFYLEGKRSGTEQPLPESVAK